MAIRDTSAQDVRVETHRSLPWLKFALPAAILGLAVVAAFSVFSTWLSAEASVSADRIRLAQVHRGDLVRDLSVQGRVVAAISPTLYSPATGTVNLEVKPGDTVKQDQVLATIDSPEVRATYLQEVSTLDRLVAELEREKIQARKEQVKGQQLIDLAQVQLTAAEREMRRAETSIKTNAISQIDYERARDELSRAEVEHKHAVDDARLQSESLQFETQTRQLAVDRQNLVVDEFNRRVEQLAIRSPVNGIVGNIVVTQKALVEQNAALITVVDLTAFEVEVMVPESYADDLGIGLGGTIRYNNQDWRGELISMSPEVNNNEVAGRIRFSGGSPPGLRQNQRVTVQILIDELNDVLKLQRGSFAETGGGRVAFVLGPDGLAVKREISLGARSSAEVEVLDGLQEGDQVIISSISEFEKFDTVQIVN
ncbi:MAG TPA: HlyD family efflux transporter periplasmic adaptor subunit [Xanthomonadales bacterium]|nr:HlyD family efflux transporter periplasmic adaptor subunit [Xanthomonadales bacterium]